MVGTGCGLRLVDRESFHGMSGDALDRVIVAVRS